MSEFKKGSSFQERRDESYLCKCLLGDCVRDELCALDKHEIIVKIAAKIGSSPENLRTAENIFETVRYEMARFVLHHEYSSESGIRTKLLLWLDSKINPQEAAKVTDFFGKYLK